MCADWGCCPAASGLLVAIAPTAQVATTMRNKALGISFHVSHLLILFGLLSTHPTFHIPFRPIPTLPFPPVPITDKNSFAPTIAEDARSCQRDPRLAAASSVGATYTRDLKRQPCGVF